MGAAIRQFAREAVRLSFEPEAAIHGPNPPPQAGGWTSLRRGPTKAGLKVLLRAHSTEPVSHASSDG